MKFLPRIRSEKNSKTKQVHTVGVIQRSEDLFADDIFFEDQIPSLSPKQEQRKANKEAKREKKQTKRLKYETIPFTTTISEEVGSVKLCPKLWRHPLRFTGWLIARVYGWCTILLMLAILASIPILNIFVLGYFLEAQGRVARTGKLRYAFPLMDIGPRLTSIALGLTIWILPLWIFAQRSVDATIFDQGGPGSTRMKRLLIVVSLLVFVHLCFALARGGSFWTFFRPIKNIRWFRQQLRSPDHSISGLDSHTYWEHASQLVSEFIGRLRIKHLFLLGLKGAIGALLWIFLPTLLLATADRPEDGKILVTLIGGLLLLPIISWLPYLQVRLGAENRWSVMREWRQVRHLFKRTPLTWMISTILFFALALPYYLLKARLVDPGAMWLWMIVYVTTAFLARMIIAWSYARAVRKQGKAWWGWIWLCRVTLIPGLMIFVVIVFLSQGVGMYGKALLFDHHAFLMPLFVHG